MGWGWGLLLVLILMAGQRYLKLRKRATDAADAQTLLEHLPDAVMKISSAGTIVYANPAASNLLGYSVRELTALSVEDLVPEEQRHHHHHWRTAFAHSGQSRTMGQWNAPAARHKSGRAIPIRIVLASLPTPAGAPHAVMATLYPALDSERMLEQVERDAGLGTWEWDLERNKLNWSRSIFQMFGLDPNRFEASYEAYLEQVHPDDRERVAQHVDRSLEEGEPYEIEYRIVRDGEIRHLLERNYLNRDELGVVHHMWGSVADITEQRRAQARLQLAETVFSHCAEGLVVFNDAQKPVRTNPALLEMVAGDSRAVSRLSADKLLLAADGETAVTLPELLTRDDACDNEWRGELQLKRLDGTALPILASVSMIAREPTGSSEYVLLCNDIRQLKEQEELLRHQALHDSLTGLPNRSLFAEHLERGLARSQRSLQRLAVVYADLDGFKQVNDRYGHDAGDLLLRQVAERLQQLIRRSDTVARMGGDEFALILPDCGDNEHLGHLLARILAEGTHRYLDLSVTLSLGAACYPDTGSDGAELQILADQAMYRAKRSGKNRYVIAEPAQDPLVL